MFTENTYLKNVTPAEMSNTSVEMDIEKSNTYQRSSLIVAGSLLALFVWIAIAGKISGQRLKSSVHEITKGVDALAVYQVNTVNLTVNKDIFGTGVVPENEEADRTNSGLCCGCFIFNNCCWTKCCPC
mmetsp:Transcript_42815/g.48594  ORF Transcript_42815/g.48594 Transcript_42815/m.48594 type:complete len:128 (+) Transcript_42815:75-458(+)